MATSQTGGYKSSKREEKMLDKNMFEKMRAMNAELSEYRAEIARKKASREKDTNTDQSTLNVPPAAKAYMETEEGRKKIASYERSWKRERIKETNQILRETREKDRNRELEEIERGNDPNSSEYDCVDNGNDGQDRRRYNGIEKEAKKRQAWEAYSTKAKTLVEKNFHIYHNDWMERKKEEVLSLQKRIDVAHHQHLCTRGTPITAR